MEAMGRKQAQKNPPSRTGGFVLFLLALGARTRLFNQEPFSFNKAFRYLLARYFIDALKGCSANAHAIGACLLVQVFQIHQAQTLHFFQLKNDILYIGMAVGAKGAKSRALSDSTVFSRSWHVYSSFAGVLERRALSSFKRSS